MAGKGKDEEKKEKVWGEIDDNNGEENAAVMAKEMMA